MEKLSEEKKNTIRALLLRGMSIRETAEAVGVSESTVKRTKKDMPEEAPASVIEADNPNSLTYKRSEFLSKAEKKYAGRLKGEMELYEDEEEGWVFHLTKADQRLRTSGRWWNGIVYPESAPEGWVKRLRATQMEIAISPLHDMDEWGHDSPEMVNPKTGEIVPKGGYYRKGDRKKAHWHIIVKCDKQTSARDINALVRPITCGPYLQKCRSLKNSYDYFVHLNDPEKYQRYLKSDIQKYNGFHVEATKWEQSVLMNEIMKWVGEEMIDSMAEVRRKYQDQLEYVNLLTTRSGFLQGLLRTNYQLNHPEEKVHRNYPMSTEEYEEFLEKVGGKGNGKK